MAAGRLGGNDDIVVDARRGEFLCPLCSTISSCVIPHFPRQINQQQPSSTAVPFSMFVNQALSEDEYERYLADLFPPWLASEREELLPAASAFVDRIFSFTTGRHKALTPATHDEWPTLCVCSAVAHTFIMAPGDYAPQILSFIQKTIRSFLSKGTLAAEMRAALIALLAGQGSPSCTLSPTPFVTPKHCAMLSADGEVLPVVDASSFSITLKPILAHDLNALMVLATVLAPDNRRRDVLALFCWLRLIQISIEPPDDSGPDLSDIMHGALEQFREMVRKNCGLSYSAGSSSATFERWLPFLQLANRLQLATRSLGLAEEFSTDQRNSRDLTFDILEQIGIPRFSDLISSGVLATRAARLSISLITSFNRSVVGGDSCVTLARDRHEASVDTSLESFAGSILQHLTTDVTGELPPHLLQYLSSMRGRQQMQRIGAHWPLVGLDPMHPCIDQGVDQLSNQMLGDVTAAFNGLRIADLSHLSLYRSTLQSLGLITLPENFSDLYSHTLDTARAFNNVDVTEPAICLICSRLIFAGNRLNTDAVGGSSGECTMHSQCCGAGVGVFLMLRRAVVLLVHGKHAVYRQSLYLDEDGEVDQHMRSNKPLFLSRSRLQELNKLYLRHEIPREVARQRHSSHGEVIRNSWY